MKSLACHMNHHSFRVMRPVFVCTFLSKYEYLWIYVWATLYGCVAPIKATMCSSTSPTTLGANFYQPNRFTWPSSDKTLQQSRIPPIYSLVFTRSLLLSKPLFSLVTDSRETDAPVTSKLSSSPLHFLSAQTVITQLYKKEGKIVPAIKTRFIF